MDAVDAPSQGRESSARRFRKPAMALALDGMDAGTSGVDGLRGLGFRGSGFRGSGFRVEGLGVQGLDFEYGAGVELGKNLSQPLIPCWQKP